MASTQIKSPRSLPAAEDLSSALYLFATETTSNTYEISDAITDQAAGVLQNAPDTAGLTAVVQEIGYTKVVAAAALAVGVLVAPDATGKAQVAVATQYPRGKVIEAAGAASDLATIRLIESGVPIPAA